MSDNFGRNKNTVIIALGVAVLALMLLATTLLNSGWETSNLFDPVTYYSDGFDPNIDTAIPSLRSVLVVFILILIVVSAIAVLRYPFYAVRTILLTLAVAMLLSSLIDPPEQIPSSQGSAGEGLTLEQFAEENQLESIEVDEAPTWISAAVALFVVFGIVMLVIALVMLWRMWFPENESAPALELQLHARETVEKIEAGFDLKHAILNCYAQMLQTVREQRGITRKTNMTAHEFEGELIKLGLPTASVQRLTQLFEEVRYGSDTLGGREQREAVDCLNTIVAAIEA